MPRKDYEKFAAMLASHDPRGRQWDAAEYEAGYEAARQDIGRSLAAMLRLDDERFDAARFYEAAKLANPETPCFSCGKIPSWISPSGRCNECGDPAFSDEPSDA